MKYTSYQQLQLRMFLGLLLLFSISTIGYRFFIEQPKLEASISKISQRELTSIELFSKKSLSSLQALVYDYGVWDSTYHFVEEYDADFIHENFINDTFISLKIDGVFIFDKNFKRIFTKGFHHIDESKLEFDFYDLSKHPENKIIYPEEKSTNDVMSNFGGVLSTKYGPALFSAQSIKMSDKSGHNVGFIMFLQLMQEPFYKQLEDVSFAKIEASRIDKNNYSENYLDWFSPYQLQKVVPYSYRTINDIHDKPIIVLKIKHSQGELPAIVDTKSFIYIIVFGSLIFYVFSIFSSVVMTPIKKLADDIKKMDESDKLTFLDEEQHIRELHDVSICFNKLVTTVQEQKKILNQQALIDPLTKINNRRGFEQQLEQYSQLLLREKISFTLVLIDIDHFKLFNDAQGHIEGDHALVEVAKLLNKCCQRTNDVCARYGGEEFVLLLSHIPKSALEVFLQKLLEDFETLNLAHPASPTANHLTVSMGACLVEYPSEPIKKLPIKPVIRTADKALYKAKHNGRNTFEIVSFYEQTE